MRYAVYGSSLLVSIYLTASVLWKAVTMKYSSQGRGLC